IWKRSKRFPRKTKRIIRASAKRSFCQPACGACPGCIRLQINKKKAPCPRWSWTWRKTNQPAEKLNQICVMLVVIPGGQSGADACGRDDAVALPPRVNEFCRPTEPG